MSQLNDAGITNHWMKELMEMGVKAYRKKFLEELGTAEDTQIMQTSVSISKMVKPKWPLSRPLDVNYVLEQGQGHGHLPKYLISGLIFLFFSCLYKKKKFKPFSKKKGSLDISLQHKNSSSNEFSKKKLLYLAENRAGAERVSKLLKGGCLRSTYKKKWFKINFWV